MGTRNLTMVISNGKTKVAQYGQWDGYPEGQGKTVLEFLQKTDVSDFKTRIDGLFFFTAKKLKEMDKNYTETERKYPYLSRDLGAQILNAIYLGEFETSGGIGKRITQKCAVSGLINKEKFAADSLFCEWAYVIDLDKNTLEVYEGFNTTPLAENERFYPMQQNGLHKDGEEEKYYPIKLAKSYDLNNLPTFDTFIKDLVRVEEES